MIFLLVAVLAAIGTIIGLLGHHWWVFELFSHFRVQYTVVLLTSAVFYLVRASYGTSIVFGILALANLYFIYPFSVKAEAPRVESKKLRALLTNVNHGNFKYEQLRNFIRSSNADFVILVEVNANLVSQIQSLFDRFPYYRLKPDGEFGIALLSRIPFREARIEKIGGVGLPSVIAGFEIEGRSLRLIGTHLYSPVGRRQSRYRNEQIAALTRFISAHQETTILLGDLNLTPWSPYFNDLLAAAGLRDTREGFGIQPTWPVRLPLFWLPIDHVLVTRDVIVHDRRIGPNVGSDHYPVLVDFSITSRHSKNTF